MYRTGPVDAEEDEDQESTEDIGDVDDAGSAHQQIM